MPHPLPSPLTKSLDDKGKVSLLLLPDLHVPHSPDILERIPRSRLMERLDHVVILGDTVAFYGTDHEYAALGEFLTRLSKPYSAVIGNHEFTFEVHPPEGGQYGKIWKTPSREVRLAQLARFRRFFQIEPDAWCDWGAGAGFLHFMLGDWQESVAARFHVKHEHDSLKELPDGVDAFFRKSLDETRLRGAPLIAFCHLPLSGSLPPEFVYYDVGRDPTLYLEAETLEKIKTSGVPVLWCSGHLHLSPSHPCAGVKKVCENLFQVHCPSSRWGVRRELSDIHAKRYEESYALVLEVSDGKPSLMLWDWLGDGPAELPAAFRLEGKWPGSP